MGWFDKIKENLEAESEMPPAPAPSQSPSQPNNHQIIDEEIRQLYRAGTARNVLETMYALEDIERVISTISTAEEEPKESESKKEKVSEPEKKEGGGFLFGLFGSGDSSRNQKGKAQISAEKQISIDQEIRNLLEASDAESDVTQQILKNMFQTDDVERIRQQVEEERQAKAAIRHNDHPNGPQDQSHSATADEDPPNNSQAGDVEPSEQPSQYSQSEEGLGQPSIHSNSVAPHMSNEEPSYRDLAQQSEVSFLSIDNSYVTQGVSFLSIDASYVSHGNENGYDHGTGASDRKNDSNNLQSSNTSHGTKSHNSRGSQDSYANGVDDRNQDSYTSGGDDPNQCSFTSRGTEQYQDSCTNGGAEVGFASQGSARDHDDSYTSHDGSQMFQDSYASRDGGPGPQDGSLRSHGSHSSRQDDCNDASFTNRSSQKEHHDSYPSAVGQDRDSHPNASHASQSRNEELEASFTSRGIDVNHGSFASQADDRQHDSYRSQGNDRSQASLRRPNGNGNQSDFTQRESGHSSASYRSRGEGENDESYTENGDQHASYYIQDNGRRHTTEEGAHIPSDIRGAQEEDSERPKPEEKTAPDAGHHVVAMNESEEVDYEATLPADVMRGNAREVDHDPLYGPREAEEGDGDGEGKGKRQSSGRKKFVSKAERLKALEATCEEQDIQLQKTLVEMDIMSAEKRALERQIELQDKELEYILQQLEKAGKYTPKSGLCRSSSISAASDELLVDLKEQLREALLENEALATSATKDDSKQQLVELEEALEKMRETLKKSMAAHQREKDKLLDKISGLEIEKTHHGSELEERTQQLKEANAELERLRVLENEFIQLKEEHDSIARMQVHETSRQEYENLSMEISRLTEVNTEIDSTLDETRTRIAELESENAELKKAASDYQNQLDEKLDNISSLESSLEAVRVENQALQGSSDAFDALRQKLSELETENAAEQKHSESLTQELQEMRTAFTETKKELQEALNRIDAMELETGSLREEKAEAIQKVADIEASASTYRDESHALSKELSDLRSSVAASEKQSDEAADKIRSLQEEIESLQREELKATHALTQVETSLDEATAESEALHERVQQLEKSVTAREEEKQQLANEISELNNALSETEKKLSGALKNIDKLEAEFASLHEDKEEAETEKGDLEVALQESESNAEQLQSKVDDLADDLYNLKDAYAKAEKQIHEATEDKENAVRERNDFESALQESETTVEELRSRVDDLADDLYRLKSASAEAEKSFESKEGMPRMESELARARQETQSAIEVKDNIEAALHASESSAEKLKADVERLENSVLASSVEKDALIQACSDLKAALMNAEEHLKQATNTIEVLGEDLKRAESQEREAVETIASLEASRKDDASATELLQLKIYQLEQEKKESDGVQHFWAQEINELKASVKDLEQQVRDANDKLNASESEKSSLTVIVAERSSALDEKAQEFESASLEISNLQEQLGKTNKDLQEIKDAMEALEKSSEEHQLELATLKLREETLKKEKASLSDSIAQLCASVEEKTANLQNAEQEIKKHELAIDEYKHSFASVTEDKVHLEKRLDVSEKERKSAESSLQNARAEMEKLRQIIDRLKSDVGEARDEKETLASRSLKNDKRYLKELDTVKEERDSLRETVQRISQELDESKVAREDAESSLAEREKVIEKIRADLAKSQADSDERERVYLKEIEALKVKLEGVESAADVSQGRAKEMSERISTIESEKATLEADFEKIETERSGLVMEKARLQQVLNETESTVVTLKGKLKSEGSNQNEDERLLSEIANLQSSVESKEDRLLEANANLEEAAAKNRLLENNLDRANEKLQNVLSSKALLEESLEEAKQSRSQESEHKEHLKAERESLTKQIIELEKSLEQAIQERDDSAVDEDAEGGDVKPGDGLARTSFLLAQVSARLKMMQPDGTVRSKSSENQNDGNEDTDHDGDENQALEDENEELKETVAELERQLEVATKKLDFFAHENDAQINYLHKTLSDAENVLASSWKVTYRTTDEGMKSTLQERLSTLVIALKDNVALLEETRGRLDSTVSEKRSLEAKLIDTTEELEALKSAKHSIEQALDKANETIVRMESRGLDSTDGKPNLEKEKRLLASRIAELRADLEKTIYEPEDALASEDSLVTQLHEASQRFQELDALISARDAGAKRTQYEAEFHVMWERVESIIKIVQEKEHQIEEMNRVLDKALSESYLSGGESTKISQGYGGSNSDISTLEKEKRTLKSAIADLEEIVDVNKGNLKAVQVRLDGVLSDRLALKSQIDRLSTENERLVDDEQHSMTAYRQLQVSLKTSESAMAMYRDAMIEAESILRKDVAKQSGTARGSGPDFVLERIKDMVGLPFEQKESEDTVTDVKKELDKAISAKSSLETKYNVLAQERENLIEEKKTLEKNVMSAVAELEDIRKVNATLMAEKERLRSTPISTTSTPPANHSRSFWPGQKRRATDEASQAQQAVQEREASWRAEIEVLKKEKSQLESDLREMTEHNKVLLRDLGLQVGILEGNLSRTEEERDELKERAANLFDWVLKLEEDKENEIHLLDIVMGQLQDLEIQSVTME